jgi:hypothetical protein
MNSSSLKKNALLILIISAVSFCYADQSFRKPKFYLDARLGLGGSLINGDFPSEMKSCSNGSISLVALYRIKSKLMFESGIGISNFANSYKSSGLIAYKAKYFQVPLLVRYKFYKKLSLGIGGTYHFLRNATEYSLIDDQDDIDITGQMTNNFPSATLSLQLGDQGFYLGCVYDYGLTNMRADAVVWKANSFRIYLQMNISEFIKQRTYKN